MNMKRMMLAMGIAAVALEGAAAAKPTYSLGNPRVPIVCNVTNYAQYATRELRLWAISNDCYAGSSAAYFRGSNMGSNLVDVVNKPIGNLKAYSLDGALAGFPAERNKPQCYLGDTLPSPEGVDWNATYLNWETNKVMQRHFLVDVRNQCVYAIEGGLATFTWVLADGTPVDVVINISPVGSGRPKNIFWTDTVYGGTPVDLSGKYADLYGPSNILAVGSALRGTGQFVNGVEVSNTVVTSGLYIDYSSGDPRLLAAGELEGQVVLVYYDSALHERIVDVQVVEVTRPRTEVVRGAKIGEMLRPSGRGYNASGLVASPVTLTAPDAFGPYLYQHQGTYGYSPKHKAVFPLRPTDDKTRNQTQIHWAETDNQGVSWPFEIDEYIVKWPDEMDVFVRTGDRNAPGKGIEIPTDYQCELQPYQEGEDGLPQYHATAPANGVFSSYAAGKCLLKLTADDNVWFMPVQSVLRTDRTWFTLKPQTTTVGERIFARDGSAAGLAERRMVYLDGGVPGWIYEPKSDRIWNPDFYSADGKGWMDCPSEVYPVTASMFETVTNRIEVWWSSAFQIEDMPAPVTVPSVPQVTEVVWPGEFEAPEITLASQEGSAGYSRYCEGAALAFDAADACLVLPPDRRLFSEEGGTVALWTKDADGIARDSRLLTLGTNGTGSALLTVSLANEGGRRRAVARFRDGTELRCDVPAAPDGWSHIALSWSDVTNVLSVVAWDRTNTVAQAGLGNETCKALAGFLDGNTVGADALGGTAERRRLVDEITCWSECLTAQAAHEMGSSRLGGGERDLSLYVPFRGADELLPNGSGVRTATDLVSGATLVAANALRATPGAPVIECAVIDADAKPQVYRQVDPNATGFNPNEEHAFVDAGSGGYVAWALRCDLNRAGREPASPPLTLVEYVKDGAARMARFRVVATNIFYPTLGATCEAGLALPGPRPLTLLPDPWLKEDYWKNGDYPAAERTQPYRDRKGQLWARAKGKFDIYMYYAQQNAFDWPADLRAPEIGAAVPWLAYLDGGNGMAPHKWAWNVDWPKNTAVMKIGQTLTVAADGLPEVWNAKSMAVVYPVAEDNVGKPEDTVLLADPTCSQVEKLDCRVSDLAKIGLTTEPGGKLVNSKGLYYFREVSPSLANCLFLDPSNDSLVMRGYREEKRAGTPLLFLNVLTETNKWDVLSLVKGYEKEAAYKALASALDKLVKRGVKKPTATQVVRRNTGDEIVSTYAAPDHYALTAMGATNYVVLIENDATNGWCDAGNPINMRIFRVTNEYYTGRALTREDPLNLLSQVLDVTCTETFAGQAGDYVFDWRWAKPDALGNVPEDFNRWTSKFAAKDAVGRTSFTVGGQGDTLANMVNTYWTCRYRAKDPNSAAGRTMTTNTWSAWYSPPALAEGWIQRVLNNVTPFNQRMTDLYENPAETAVTMLQEAGKPYTGGVALNQDNLTSVGLIELYRTLLDKAETMSLRLGVKDAGANQQLLLAVERLHDLYRVLGDEAYADAANPTIGFGSEYIADRVTLDYGAASSALFCFDNQVPTLLDEELALIRGRSCVNAPGNTVGPFYNRLVWNFTKGITAGEVAYAVNYDISGAKASVLDEETAARLYPQGHGDAYGHYLSALQGWYRLLRNPNFDWGRPSMSALNVADTVVNADYYEEAKFAEAAAAAARTAKRAVELTALKHWRDRGADTVGGGYIDANPTNAFGYGEWAARGAFGALCNWAVANSLLPDAEAARTGSAPYQDEGLLRIDRGTVAGIGEIASAAESIQRTEDRMDAGMNPLGFNENAVPFDLTPIGSAADATHYEQVRERAATAFANAKAILDRAQEYANRLRLIDEERTGAVDRSDALEDDYTAQLVAIYGRPYADDVGAGKTYPEGYAGPDLYHYMWVDDLSAYGLTGVENKKDAKTYSYGIKGYAKNGEITGITANGVTSNAVSTLTYTLSPNGVVVRNAGVTGTRPANGELQQAYADFLVAYGAATDALRAYERQQEHLRVKTELALAQTKALDKLGKVEDEVYKGDAKHRKIEACISKLRSLKTAASVFSGLADGEQVWIITTSIAEGKDESGLPIPAGIKLVMSGGTFAMCVAYDALRMAQAGSEGSAASQEATISKMEKMLDEADRTYSTAATDVELWDGIEEATEAVCAAASALNAAWREMNAAQVQFSALVQKGESIRESRELARQQIVNSVSKMRYNDMFFRQLRNDALAKYDAAFDLAKTYAFLAAKAYGYETGSMPEDLVREIVAARALGETDNAGNPIVSGHGDAGLAGALAKMDANWRTLRTQLGFNNPQGYATWFSLRHELFRILRGKLGDAAWKTELAKHWTDDIRSNPDFLRHCQPFVSRFGLADKEPGLVFTFETTIDFALNLFGRPLAYDDSQFDSSWFATKIASAGVWFENYNERTADYKGQETVFAATPNVYLVPVGTDRMRVPGTDGEAVADFTVLDQTVPVPYPVTAAELAEAMWLPSFLQGEYAGVDKATRIRRHPSFRAYYGAEGTKPSDGQLDAVRLTGRSVWNTKWMLVIPAGTLNSNREKALRAFIDGMDVDGDGKLDVKGVSDIRIGFKTYSYGGK